MAVLGIHSWTTVEVKRWPLSSALSPPSLEAGLVYNFNIEKHKNWQYTENNFETLPYIS